MAAEKTVLYSAMVTLGSTTAASMLPEKYGGKGELPSPRLLFGTAITFTGLAMLADFKPSIGNTLAATIAVAALVGYGIPLLDNYQKVNGAEKDGTKGAKIKLTPVGTNQWGEETP